MRNVIRDRHGELDKVALYCFKHKKWGYKPLRKLKFLFVWKLGDPRWDDEGRAIAAQTRKLPTRERDIYGFDVEMEFWRKGWKNRSTKQQQRLMWHELQHIDPEINEGFRWETDEDGRLKFKILEHDVVVTTFKKELKVWGLHQTDEPAAETLARALKKKRKKKPKKE
jgi:hypothetical protein